MICRQIEYMTRLVDDLLEVSRITSGKVALQRRSCSVAEILASAVETSQPAIDAAGHTLILNDHDAETFRVDGDPVRLSQVFSNLLNNAAKYSDSGGRIEVLVQRDGESALVSVRDQGVGIAPEMRAEVFEPFVQVDPAGARSQGGLGIGLSLAKSLVEMYGGSIFMHSDGLRRGCEFTVHLPLKNASKTGQAPPLPSPGEPAKSLGPRVLVVHDNRDAADSLALLLEMMGASVEVAYDGPAALAAARHRPPQLALLDLGMPVMDGFELARRLRSGLAGSAATRLVALSGWGQPEDRQRAKDAGFDQHLVKPADPAALPVLLNELKVHPA